MKVVVTGATGFTGAYVVPRLLDAGHSVCCFVRPSSNRSSLAGQEVEFAEGDLDDASSLEQALRGRDALVNIASLGFGHAPKIVEAIVRSGVRRAVFISTTALFTSLNAPSKTVRMAAEQTIRDSGIDYTILRPTMIYGSSKDRNICRLVRFLKRWPVIPIVGHGRHLQQPVYVADVAAAVAASLSTDVAIRKEYNISGAAPLTFNELIDTVCRKLHRRVFKLHLPAGIMIAALSALERVRIRLPIKAEQLERLNEDKAFDSEQAARDFGYAPLGFEEGIELQLAEMGFHE